MTGTGPLFLGVDGGGTSCRVRLVDDAGRVLGAGSGGSANIRLGLDIAWGSILAATDAALAASGLARDVFSRLQAGLGLAGVKTKDDIDRVRAGDPGFAGLAVAGDEHTACLGAFAGADGGIVIIGTGCASHAVLGGVPHSVGGWGFEIADLGSGADIGREAIRAAVLAYDALGPASGFTTAVLERLGRHPAQVMSWADTARPRDYAGFARDTLDWAATGDAVAAGIVTRAVGRIDDLIGRLRALGAGRIALMGGLAPAFAALLPAPTQAVLTSAEGDAVDGAILLARRTRLDTESKRCGAS